MNIKFNIAVDDDGNGAISIYTDGAAVTVQHDHPNFSRISQALVRGEDPTPLLSLGQFVSEIDERVKIYGDVVYFDGEAIHNSLTRTILRYFREGRDTTGLVRFMERLTENPSRRGREVIFEWVQDKDLTITEDGAFIGWKGVSHDMRSVHSGKAVVETEDEGPIEHTGRIPNEVGSIVSMPRSEVMDDPNADCHVGLHVGTYEYARGFGNVLLEVEVGPEDVVSVPASSTSWKIRCCKYKVLRVHEGETEAFDVEYEAEAEFDGEDPGLDDLALVIPASFMDRLRSKWLKRNP